MKIDHRTGLVEPVKFVASPNYDQRPLGSCIDCVVLHCISLPPGCYGGSEIEEFFCNCLDHTRHRYFEQIAGIRVSAHFLIRRHGQLVQFVSTLDRAWHAGESSFRGRSNVNNFSIGIELEGTEDQLFDELQYQTLFPLIRLLAKTYPNITSEGVVGHSDIAPGRKTDPGNHFDWARLRSEIV